MTVLWHVPDMMQHFDTWQNEVLLWILFSSFAITAAHNTRVEDLLQRWQGHL